jgi:hypothetical protein
MYAEITYEEPYEIRNEIGYEYSIEGEYSEDDPFFFSVSFGYLYSEEDGGYYLICSVLWYAGITDYEKVGTVLIDEESLKKNRLSPEVKEEMETMLKDLLREYPMFKYVRRYLGWKSWKQIIQ